MKTERDVANSNEKDRCILINGSKEANVATHIECVMKMDAHRNLQKEFR